MPLKIFEKVEQYSSLLLLHKGTCPELLGSHSIVFCRKDSRFLAVFCELCAPMLVITSTISNAYEKCFSSTLPATQDPSERHDKEAVNLLESPVERSSRHLLVAPMSVAGA